MADNFFTWYNSLPQQQREDIRSEWEKKTGLSKMTLYQKIHNRRFKRIDIMAVEMIAGRKFDWTSNHN